MKIAIVAPSPVPFTIGGAEKLWWGLQQYINEHTDHQCELMKLPTRENSFWDLIESYQSFYKLDLSYFDMVVSTKYPAWMVSHKNHVLYLQHHLRGLFDTYYFCNEPETIPRELKVDLIDQIMNTIENLKSPDTIDEVFDLLTALKSDQRNYPKELFKFPGPFIRNIIQYFDDYALGTGRIQRYYAISKNVQLRKDYFPQNVEVKVLYHPSKIENFTCKNYEYIFTVSRLDSPKRIDCLIRAMKFVPHNVQFKIAGTGPEEEKLKKLAGTDERIEFLGHISEEKLIDLYSGALCILYIPYDEDYGLITIEGMKSKKPIITAWDSGGSLEFVNNYETGFIVEADPEKIAERINYFIEKKGEVERMGFQAYHSVRSITWQNVVNELLNEKKIESDTKKKILVLSTYSCFPPRGGGQHRLFHLYSRLAKEFDVTICSIIESNKKYKNLVLANGLKQVCIPQSREHAENQWYLERSTGCNLYDICMIDFLMQSDEYVQNVKNLMKNSDIIIFSHPYLFEFKKYATTSQKTVYEAHNSEYLLKKGYINDTTLLSKIFSIEEQACNQSDMIWSTSEEDRQNLIQMYNISPDKIVTIPNGVDVASIRFVKNEERTQSKDIAGITGYPTILFVGSWHPPNLEAVNFIVESLAKKCKIWKFLIIGSIKDYYLQEKGKFPNNVLAFGAVNENEKYELYKLADIAINPMFSGSGTNLKMIDYMSAGVPIITTTVGARGLSICNQIDALICEPDQFFSNIQVLLKDGGMRESLRMSARKVVEDRFSWDSIGKIAAEYLHVLDPVS